MDAAAYRLDQRRFLCRRQTLILTGDQLKVQWRRGLSLNEYRFNLREFLPDPLRMKRIPIAGIIRAGVITVMAVILFVALMSGEVKEEYMFQLLLAGPVSLLCAVLAWSSVARETFNVVLFEGPGGQFVLWPDRPGKEEFEEFLSVLSARIRNSQPQQEVLLQLLRRAEIIDDWQFEQAVQLLEQRGIVGRPGNPSADE